MIRRNPATLSARVGQATLLTAIVGLGAFLRLSGLTVPSLWLDEILGEQMSTAATKEPWWHWLTGMGGEHGPLYYATELAGHGFRSPELSARFAPVLFGITTIIVAWLAARHLRICAPGTAAIFALLLACSPLHVYYSREARPYALLMLLTTCMIALLLRASSAGMVPVLLFLAVLTSAGAAPLIAATTVTAAIAFLLERDTSRRRFFALAAIAGGVGGIAVPLQYRHQLGFSATSVFHFNLLAFRQLLHSFSVVALDTTQTHRAAYVVFLFACIGVIALFMRDRARGAVVTGMAVLPFIVSLAALWRLHHWYAIRYVLTSLPGYLLLAAVGTSVVAEMLVRLGGLAIDAGVAWGNAARSRAHTANRRPGERSATPGNLKRATATLILGLIIAMIIVHDGWPAARIEPFRKPNWRVLAATIWNHARDHDVLLTSNDWAYVCLGFYLDRMPPRLRLMSARELIGRATDVESTRLHYAPGLQDLLLHRMTPADERAFAASFGNRQFTLDFGPDEDLLFASGWYGAEGGDGDFTRWAGRTASLIVPASGAADRRIDFRAIPIRYPNAPPQIMSIALNGAPLAQIPIDDDWRDYSIEAKRDRWRDGINILSFAFSRATAPSSISSSLDSRILSVDFHQLTVRQAATPSRHGTTPAKSPVTIHINAVDDPGSATYLDEGTSLSEPEPWLRAHTWNREALTALLGRLGFDPRSTIPDLEHGNVRLDELTVSVATDSDCQSDLDFLRRAYTTLLDRAVDPIGERHFLDVLRRHHDRESVVRSIIDSAEFRGKIVAQ